MVIKGSYVDFERFRERWNFDGCFGIFEVDRLLIQFQYQRTRKSLQMASLEPKSPYSRHSPYSRDPVDPPSRSRVFSQLDNQTQNQSRTYQNDSLKPSENIDRIAQIKKKYDKLLNKSTHKPHDTFQNPPKEYNRSALRATDYKTGYVTRPYGASQEGEKMYSRATENPVTPTKTQPYGRDHYGAQNNELKSQLDCNRSALTAMKSELQARLTELSTKTIMSSALRKNGQQTNQCSIDSTRKDDSYKPSSKQSYNDYSKPVNSSYDQISKRYERQSRGPNQKRPEKQNQPASTAKPGDNFPPPYKNTKYNNTAIINEKNRILKQQLSIISQKSNSNKSESFNILDLDSIVKESKVQSSNVREIVDPHYDQLFKGTDRNQGEGYQEQKWLKSTCSYFEEKNANSAVKHQMDKDVTLYKLQNNVGPIKRTETEENFASFNKATHFSMEPQDRKERITNNYVDIACQKEKNKYEPSKYNGLHIESDVKEATFGKKAEIVHKGSETSAFAKEKTVSNNDEIEKFKEKYRHGNPPSSTSTRENPNREPEKQTSWKNYEFRDNKDLSSKIDKIDQRIKEIQANKRNLNINFRPYEAAKSTPKYTKQEPKNVYQLQQRQSLIEKYSAKASEVPPSHVQSVKEDEINYSRPRIASYYDKVKPMYSDSTIPQASKTHSNGFSIKLHPVEISNQEDNYSMITANKSQSEWKNKMQLQSRTDSGIEQRKKKLQQKFQVSTNIKSLVKILGQQAVFDEMFRNNKIWFASENKDNKWQILENQLRNSSINLSQTAMREDFELLQTQNNPFFSVSDNKCDIKTLVKSYVQAQKHWKQKLSKQYRRELLEREGFVASKLDLDKKGYILIEDLVRFLNIESGTFLRNRDLSIIFRRINKKSEKIMFEDILSAICP